MVVRSVATQSETKKGAQVGLPYLHCLLTWTFLVATPAIGLNQNGVAGDRLVVSINNVPHTQRQVEAYITIKESLRQNVEGPTLLISARNWETALTVYIRDMVIMQESVRLGSFQPNDQLVDKFVGVVREKAMGDSGLRHEMERLGIQETSLKSVIDAILRVDGFRRSKDRQAAVGGKSPQVRGQERWLTELEDRAVIRQYKDATNHVRILPQPKAPGGNGG